MRYLDFLHGSLRVLHLPVTVQNMTVRSALKEKDEELKSFKDRVAEQVAPSIKTGTAMSLNSPVTKNRIKEMYEDLRCDWPEIKDRLKSTKDADTIKLIIQEKFEYAKADMEKKKKHTDELFELNDKSVAPSPKNEQYRQLTIQNLQLALYNQKFVPGSKNTHDVMEYLTSECYWLGCLMALNNPPLQPDWEHHPPSMDKWDILPRNISVISEKNQDETQQQKTFCSSV
ncbi:hypothetical protein AMECASPLE_034563 [Ameca splendens]|uniref:Uncharacterized protein n=1 Tax=Ameca splendens TaxID=208324 RepID=A0ABV0YI66_9TELE